jgi:hypothetical protein
MRRMRLIVTVIAVLAATISPRAQIAPAGIVDYDTFMKQDVDGRLRIFNEVTPENRAELVQTQIKRWVEPNRARLTPEQLKVMDENLAFVTADRYRQPMNEQQEAQAMELQTRTAALFTREEMAQSLTIRARYIPK